MTTILSILFSTTVLPLLVGWWYGLNQQEPYSVRGRFYYRESLKR
jgi:hypothetical protein